MAGNEAFPGSIFGFPNSQQFQDFENPKGDYNDIPIDLLGVSDLKMSEWRHNAAEIDQYGYSTGINCEPSNFIGNNTGLQRIANSKCPNMFSDPIQSLPLEFSETDLSANPMARFCYDQGPWNSHQVSAGSSAAYPPQSSYVYPLPARGPNFAVGNYRSAPVSEPESNATANMLSDSGYGTKTFSTVSALSHQMTETNTEYLSLQHQLHNLQPFAVPQHQPHVTGPFDIANPFENNLKSLPDPIPQPTHQCPYCEMSYRCASELKKHILKHEKNYKCREPGCKRNEGFSTPNDLERHKKTVHHIFPRNSTTKMYRCVAEDCKVNGNIWVRPDNFRAHVRRKHGEDRLQELMRLGECYDAVPNQSTNSSIVDQYDHYEEWLDAPQAVNTKNWRQGNVTNWEYKRAQGPYHPTDQVASAIEYVLRDGGHTLASLLESTQDTQEDRGSVSSSSCSTVVGPTTALNPEILKASSESVPSQALRTYLPPRARLKSTVQTPLGTLLKDKGDHISGDVQSVLSQVISSKRQSWKCKSCSKNFPQFRELKNHEKCHEKPYGCTFPDCPEAYKSRRKWKAHENNEHWIPKSWRCRLPTDQLDLSATLGEYNREECAKIMHTREGFWKHLQSTHGISSRKILVDEATACFIGDKGSDGFWCGFCREIKPRSTEDFAAWDERLDHVQAHIDCEHRLMDEWVPVDKARTKGEIFAVTLDVDSDEDSDEDCSQSIIDLHLDDPWPLRSSYTDANAPCVNHQLHEAERDPDLENQAPKKRKRNF